MNRVPILFSILLLPIFLVSEVNAESALAACKKSITHKYEIEIHDSISEGAMNYREYEDVKFGTLDEQRAFVQYKERAWDIESISFKDPQRSTIRLESESVAIDRSDLYVRIDKNLKTYCVLVPFSGIGSSGSFQQFAALIAIRGGLTGDEVEIAGEVVKRH